MALSPDQLAVVREEIGTTEPPSDVDLDDIHDRVGGVVGVVRSVLKSAFADLVLGLPAQFNVSGQYGQNTGTNIDAIRKRLIELSGLPDDSDELPPATTEGGRPVDSLLLERCDPVR